MIRICVIFLLNRHLTRHQLVKAALLERYPDYFVE